MKEPAVQEVNMEIMHYPAEKLENSGRTALTLCRSRVQRKLVTDDQSKVRCFLCLEKLGVITKEMYEKR